MKLIFNILFLFISVISFGQNFEGTLTYRLEMEIKPSFQKMGITKERMIESMKKDGLWADKIETSYKLGNYYSLMQDSQKTKIVYLSDSNRLYTYVQYQKVNTVDVSIDNEFKLLGKKPTIELLDTIAQVYNRSCKIIRVKWTAGYYDYYFNSDFLKMSSSLYKNYVLDGWYGFLNISNALPLKIVKSTEGVVVSMTLINVEEKKISDDLFH